MADDRVAQIEARLRAASNEIPPGWRYDDFHHNAFPDIEFLLAQRKSLEATDESKETDRG